MNLLHEFDSTASKQWSCCRLLKEYVLVFNGQCLVPKIDLTPVEIKTKNALIIYVSNLEHLRANAKLHPAPMNESPFSQSQFGDSSSHSESIPASIPHSDVTWSSIDTSGNQNVLCIKLASGNMCQIC